MAQVNAGLGKYVGKFNGANEHFIQFKMTAPAASADTLQCAIPDHLDKDAIPLSAVCFSRAITGVLTSKPVTITSHQLDPDVGQVAPQAVGVTILTVGASALVVGDLIQINYSSTKLTY